MIKKVTLILVLSLIFAFPVLAEDVETVDETEQVQEVLEEDQEEVTEEVPEIFEEGFVDSDQQNVTDAETLTEIEKHLKTLVLIAAAFFVWQVIKIIYNLFAGVFFGGL